MRPGSRMISSAGARQHGGFGSRPALEQRDRLVHIAVRRPIGVEGRRFVRDLDVFDQGRDDLVAPALVDVSLGPGDVDHFAISINRARRCPASAADFPQLAPRSSRRPRRSTRPTLRPSAERGSSARATASSVGAPDRRGRDRVGRSGVRRIADEVEDDIGDDADDHRIGKGDRLAKGKPQDPAAGADNHPGQCPGPCCPLLHCSGLGSSPNLHRPIL